MPWPFDDKPVAYRASMLPVGNYEDGSIAFPVWPQGAVDAYQAMGRFHRGEAPQPQDAVLAGLAMAGSGLGHLGLRGRVTGSVAGAERAEASSGRPSIGAEAGSFDFSPGQPRSADIGRSSLSYLPEDGMVELTALGTPEAYRGQGAATQAMQQFTGALDEGGLPSRLVARGDAGTDPFRLQQFYASHGYGAPGPDGYMVRPAKPTGETLFANPKDAAPAGLLATGEGEPSQQDFMLELLRRHGFLPQMTQAQTPTDHLQGRGYLDKVPPSALPPRVTTPETDKIWQDYALPRVEVLKHLGVPGYEAWDIISEMPDVQEAKRKAYENNTLPPDFEELLRR